MNTEKEISALRKAGRDREQDLATLNSVLQCNQDLIDVRAYACTRWQPRIVFSPSRCNLTHPKPDIFYQDLRVALGEKEQKLKEVENEVELWRRKDRALTTVLQEKEAQIGLLQTALQTVKSVFCPLTILWGSSPDHHRSPKSIFTAINLWKSSRSLFVWFMAAMTFMIWVDGLQIRSVFLFWSLSLSKSIWSGFTWAGWFVWAERRKWCQPVPGGH